MTQLGDAVLGCREFVGDVVELLGTKTRKRQYGTWTVGKSQVTKEIAKFNPDATTKTASDQSM
jgi:hypothetical protein